MGATLLELVNALKGHESHQVRRFFALCVIASSFEHKVTIAEDMVRRIISGSRNWLRITATEDSDEECRKRAHALIASKIFPYDGKLSV